MKKTYISNFIFTLIALLSFTSCSYIDELEEFIKQKEEEKKLDLNVGLIAYYPFNGNANDASGYRFHGKVSNATLTSDRFGNAKSAYRFNGENSKIDIFSYTHKPQKFTVTLWFNAASDGTSGTTEFLHRCEPANLNNFSWNLSWKSYNNQNYFHSVLATKAPVEKVETTVGNDVSKDTWHMATMIFDGTYKKVYLDGVLFNSFKTSFSTIDYTNQTAIYLGYDSVRDYFNGKLDEVRVYNRPLTAAEVKSLFEEGK